MKPGPENQYNEEHAKLIIYCYKHWTGKDLLSLDSDEKAAQALYEAPIAVLCHGTERDPIFNYGNLAAQDLFEISWEELVQLPSRMSAEPVSQEERARLLDRVSLNGFVDDYKGVRISKTGKRFLIKEAVVWTLLDNKGAPCGQAAALFSWSHL